MYKYIIALSQCRNNSSWKNPEMNNNVLQEFFLPNTHNNYNIIYTKLIFPVSSKKDGKIYKSS